MLVSQYKITVKEEPQFAGETFEKKKSRILSTSQRLTLTCVSFSFAGIDERVILIFLIGLFVFL